jgi:hypothetical protein
MQRLNVCYHRTRASNVDANTNGVWKGVYIRLSVCKYRERRECMPCVNSADANNSISRGKFNSLAAKLFAGTNSYKQILVLCSKT